MILNEIDPISSRDEILPQLQEILTNLENRVISPSEALDLVENIRKDVNLRVKLTTNTYEDMHNWAFLQITIENLTNFIKEL